MGKKQTNYNAHLFYTKEIADYLFICLFSMTVVNYTGEGNDT